MLIFKISGRAPASCAAILLLLVMMSGCANFRLINQSALESKTTIEGSASLAASFSGVCDHTCLLTQLRRLSPAPLNCDCAKAAAADAQTQAISATLLAYFSTLEELSRNSSTGYDFEALKTSLSEASVLKLEEKEINALNKIWDGMSKLVTNQYRKKTIRRVLTEAGPSVDLVIGAYDRILSEALHGLLATEQGQVQVVYLDILDRSRESQFQQFYLLKDYHAELGKIRVQQAQLLAYAASLKTIRKLNQYLAAHPEELFKKKSTAELARIRTELLK